MQYVNDDMDELFRRAAENYPLDTSSANWNRVLSMMEGESKDKTDLGKKDNKNRRFLWLLLLLPLGLVCNQFYSHGILNTSPALGSGQPISTASRKNGNSDEVNIDSKTARVKESEKQNFSDGRPIGTEKAKKKSKNQGSGIDGPKNGSVFIASNGAQQAKYRSLDNRTVDTYRSEIATRSKSQSLDEVLGEQGLSHQRGFVSGVAARNQVRNTSLFVPHRALTPQINPFAFNKAAEIHITKPKRFYAGLVGGIDATTIKFQKVENAGFSFGVLGGYQLNKRWSVETGAFLERKYYYSDGKYFNTSKIYMPANSRISEVSGDCKMIEVPLSARYSFAIQKTSNWFSTIGLSSYFMTEENYTYDYYYGTVGPVSHTKQYKNSSTKVFSNISLSAGYAHTLGNFADVRIEPYFKLPISGLGIGSLPLFSMGLQLGLTKKF